MEAPLSSVSSVQCVHHDCEIQRFRCEFVMQPPFLCTQLQCESLIRTVPGHTRTDSSKPLQGEHSAPPIDAVALSCLDVRSFVLKSSDLTLSRAHSISRRTSSYCTSPRHTAFGRSAGADRATKLRTRAPVKTLILAP